MQLTLISKRARNLTCMHKVDVYDALYALSKVAMFETWGGIQCSAKNSFPTVQAFLLAQ